jgi:hypothetical protein
MRLSYHLLMRLAAWVADFPAVAIGGLPVLVGMLLAQPTSSSAQVVRPAAAPAALVAVSSHAVRDGQVYSSIRELMDSIVDPSADALWGAVKTVADKDGIQEFFPKTQEEWLEVRRAAVRIIEAGNLLVMPGREAAPAGAKSETPGVELEPAQITALVKKNRASFNAFAKALQALGAEALRASDGQNTVALTDIGGRMENVCESCHQTFWYPPEKHAAIGSSNAVSDIRSWNGP